jgi:hypothetical protein
MVNELPRSRAFEVSLRKMSEIFEAELRGTDPKEIRFFMKYRKVFFTVYQD